MRGKGSNNLKILGWFFVRKKFTNTVDILSKRLINTLLSPKIYHKWVKNRCFLTI